MEETPEGLAIAAATREAAREKKRRLQEQQQQASPCRHLPYRHRQSCTEKFFDLYC